MAADHGGGILALLSILQTYWGAVERDLQHSGYTVNDICTPRMPLSGFVAFVLHAPPGTAVFHEQHEGWTISDHLSAQQIDLLSMLLWAKTVDGQENKNRPKRVPRPGDAVEDEPEKPMTIGEYMRLSGRGDVFHQ